MVVSVWVTVTATLLFTEAPCASADRHLKGVRPRRVNVAVVLLHCAAVRGEDDRGRRLRSRHV